MQSHRNLLILTLAIVSCGALLAGCSESRPRRDSKQLSAAVLEAQRSQQRAVVLMGNPAYRDAASGQVSPLMTALADPKDTQATSRAVDKVELFGDQVHPEVPKLLADARKNLESAIAKYSAAAPQDMAQARMVLASLKKLQGDAQARGFAAQAAKVRDTLDQLASQRAAGSIQHVLATSLSAKAGESPELQKAYDDTAAALKETETQLGIKNGELKDANKRADDLRTACTAQSIDVSTLHQDLQAADPRTSQEKIRQFKQKYEELNANLTALQRLEAQIEQLKSEAAQLNVKLAGFGSKTAGGERQLLAQLKGLTQQRADAAAAAGKLVAEAQDKVKASYKAAGASAKELQDALDAANKGAADAVASYTAALGDVSEALKLTRAAAIRTSSGMRASEGSLDLAKAAVILDQRHMQQEAQNTLGVVSDAWAQMGQAKLPALTLQADKDLKDAAVKALDAAGMSFEQALLSNDSPNSKWLYDGAEGAAYLLKYDLTNDAADRKLAADHLGSAARDKEQSPNLASIVSLLDAINK